MLGSQWDCLDPTRLWEVPPRCGSCGCKALDTGTRQTLLSQPRTDSSSREVAETSGLAEGDSWDLTGHLGQQ